MFPLPECVRVAVRQTGRAGHPIAGGQYEFIQVNPSAAHWGLGVGSSLTEAKGH